MKKRGMSWGKIFGIVLLVFLLVGGALSYFAYSLFVGKNYDKIYSDRVVSGELISPMGNLTVDEAVEEFDEDFVYYLMYNIKAYNLHKSPLSGETAKLEFQIDDVVYNSEIIVGEIYVGKEAISDEDAIIRTTTLEAVKMVENREYIEESFKSGLSEIELVESNSVLFAKGYLSIYEELTGEKII